MTNSKSNITALIGDLFKSDCQTIVNTINTVGVMGKGIALEFKKQFPDMFEDYERHCKEGKVKLGEPYLYKRLTPPWILNFPTKDHWRSVSKLSDIIQGLKYLEQHYQEWGITSIAIPPLGCGYGQLEWRIVGPTLYRYVKRFNIPVELYAPLGTSKEELTNEFLSSEIAPINSNNSTNGKIAPGLVAVIEILARIEKEPYHWPVGRTLFQKIAYFATDFGIQTDLRFARSSYGPFDASLKEKITRLVNNGLIKEEQLGRMFSVKTGPTYKDAQIRYKKVIEEYEPVINKLTDLFLRINTTHQAELAATIHFAAQSIKREQNVKPTEKDVLASVMDWKQKRRPAFMEEEVAGTIRNLASLGLIDVKASNDLPVTNEPMLA